MFREELGRLKKPQLLVGLFLTIGFLLIISSIPLARAQLTAPNPKTPENDTVTDDNTPYFAWENVNGENVANYRLVIDNDSGFAGGENFYDNATLSDNFDNFNAHSENALPEKKMYWHVRAENSTENGSWSTTWSLTIDQTSPTAQISVSDDLLGDPDAGSKLTVTINYSEAMDNSICPDLSFSPDVTADSLAYSENWWKADNTTYYENYTIRDENAENMGVDISVIGGEDLAGNP